jgi:hypothetical protein
MELVGRNRHAKLMRIRELQIGDLDTVKQIHEKHFESEFALPEFQRFLAAFTITDPQDRIVTVGGVRPILELVAVTDRDLTPIVRRSAYFNILNASLYMARKHEYEQLHVFVQGEKWIKALKKVGFKDTKGQSLVLDVNI